MEHIEEASMLIKQTARPENSIVFTPELKSSMELLITKMMSSDSRLHSMFIGLLRFALIHSDQTYVKDKIKVHAAIIRIVESLDPRK